MRTQEEILGRIGKFKDKDSPSDMFGFRREVLVEYLDRERIQPFLKEGADAGKWDPREPSRENLLEDLGEYVKFGWEKIKNHRGLSAGRTIDKVSEWIWLLEDEGKLDLGWFGYAQYGAPQLQALCLFYGFEVPPGEAIARMCQGLPCYPGCDEGCGG